MHRESSVNMRLKDICVSSLAWASLAFTRNAGLTEDDTISTDGLVFTSSRFNTILRFDNGTYGPQVEEVP